MADGANSSATRTTGVIRLHPHIVGTTVVGRLAAIVWDRRLSPSCHLMVTGITSVRNNVSRSSNPAWNLRPVDRRRGRETGRGQAVRLAEAERLGVQRVIQQIEIESADRRVGPLARRFLPD